MGRGSLSTFGGRTWGNIMEGGKPSLGNLWKSMEHGGTRLGKWVLHKWNGYKARERGGKRLGWWWVLVVSTVFQIVELNHDSPFTGHLGIKGTSDLVAKGYYWEGRDQYIRDYVTGCQTCIRAKKRNYRRHGMLNPLPNPGGPSLSKT